MMSHKMLYGEEGEKLYAQLESKLNGLIGEVRDGNKTTDDAVELFLNELHKKQDDARKEIKAGKKIILTGIAISIAIIVIGSLTHSSWLFILGLMSFGIPAAGIEARKNGYAQLYAANDFGSDHFGH